MAGGIQPSSGGTGRGRRRVSSTLAEINVVPLVDVMLVLLIIFMVTAPMITRGVEVNLPTLRRAERIEAERIAVTVPLTYRDDRRVYLGEEQLALEVLQERVRQRMETAEKKEVDLRSDGGVRVQELMEVIDRLKAAGVETVGVLAAPPPRGR
jgi:biopolymer transport protein TolR